jgi:hypothetical protein
VPIVFFGTINFDIPSYGCCDPDLDKKRGSWYGAGPHMTFYCPLGIRCLRLTEYYREIHVIIREKGRDLRVSGWILPIISS